MDWNKTFSSDLKRVITSPSLRGSGLKLTRKTAARRQTQSPSLRGSGLKLQIRRPARLWVRLPLYEGVDWNFLFTWKQVRIIKSPSLRGSGLKFQCKFRFVVCSRSPSLRGSGLKSVSIRKNPFLWCLPLYEGVDWNCGRRLDVCSCLVSLFTREWIEITRSSCIGCRQSRLPLYEGVDWNSMPKKLLLKDVKSPSLRGSGLKLTLSRNWCPS